MIEETSTFTTLGQETIILLMSLIVFIEKF